MAEGEPGSGAPGGGGGAGGGGADEDPFLKVWLSYVGADKQIEKSAVDLATGKAQPQALVPQLLAPSAPNEKLVNSLKDSTWLGANQAAAKLVRKTVVPKQSPGVDTQLQGQTAADQATNQLRKAKYKRTGVAAATNKGKETQDDGTANTSTTAHTAAPTTAPAVRIKAEMDVVVPPAVAPTRVETLEQHKPRNHLTDLFATTIERPLRTATTEMIVSTPPAVAALKYCALLPSSEAAWYDLTTAAVAKRPNMSFPKSPLMRRSVLMTFLREPDPHMPHERPCFNLDRNPFNHERGLRMRCVAHRMSAEQLGEVHAFRCRELLFNGQMVKINAAVATNGAEDPAHHLNDIPELCYMCHVWLTTEAALAQRNKAGVQSSEEMLIIFNRFMVSVDQVGEYSRHATLASADVAMGIWGPFPRWSERNYRAVRLSCGLRGFEESEEMLFRPAREPSGQSVGVVAKATHSTRSGLIAASQTANSMRHP